ncbi:5344_t:CDS:2 [Dentiscutata erythropus]|uniref:5344_t:CDS:1 n=1 Tax=Dentiscutata erythropus TaxID=1348616 RepID=A0A9N8VLQ6_9GLOM|nr:5344_t:CDS:2 [Dentiscutata erythropus]
MSLNEKHKPENSISVDIESYSLEEKYYVIQLKKVFDDLMDLQSLLDKNFISYITVCVISLTVGVVFSVSDKDSMKSLSSKVLSTTISGIGGITTLFANQVLLKNLFTRNKLNTVDDLNKEQEDKPDTADKLNKEQENKPDTADKLTADKSNKLGDDDIKVQESQSDTVKKLDKKQGPKVARKHSQSWAKKIANITGYEKTDRKPLYFMRKLK